MSILKGSMTILVAFHFCVAATVPQQRTQTAPQTNGSSGTFTKCLPPELALGDIVTFRSRPAENITVKDKLIQLKARCRSGKLVDDQLREIFFFKADCWGNPPAGYLEERERRRAEIAQLRKRHYVFELPCDPARP